MNVKRYVAASVATFVFIFVFEFLWHGQLLGGLYQATQSLWRPQTEMGTYFPLIPLYQALLALVIVFLFTRHYEGKGIGEGIRFGFYIGILLGIVAASMYVFMPIPGILALGWFAGSFIVGLGSGVIASLVYRR
jgi:ABC-type transport system involved in cytochrome c biogenesis permease subunit